MKKSKMHTGEKAGFTALILIGSLLMALVAFAGCGKGTLQPGGAYSGVTASGVTNAAPDYAFFLVDSGFDLAYSSIDAAFKFEKDNRAMLWAVSPDIKHTLDKIRPQALAIATEYLRVRAVYKANPTPANLGALQTALAKIQQLSTAAVAAIPRK